ncbi:hypothetical protein [Paenibacillus antibioticophila]|uniref:hypothetical protein n=1 Tax=Paenibacillus antibioticophila TaxID=1274374 RepID=UPI0005CB01B1|nr:hypothetical protein [Paenibacillus antibioticophila]
MNSKTKLTVVLVCLMLLLSGCGSSSVLHTSAGSEQIMESSRVPWDYRIQQATVGDLVGSDMTLLPDNELLPNDGNYATGDTIWILQFMDAELTTDESQKNEIRLSTWSPLKSYPDQGSAEKDLAELKVAVTTEVGLVGVYKTEYNGDTRNFAVLELPTGNRVKQPVDDERYEQLKNVQKVAVVLEEVHDFADYDLTYAKFRGWANP